MESVPGRAVQLLHQAIDRLAADDIDHLSDPGLGEELISLRRSIDRLEAEFGRRLRRFDRLRGHVADGATSLVAWLRYRCRLSVSGAVARSQVARFLSGVPAAEDLLRRGEIGFRHAAVLAQAVEDIGADAVERVEQVDVLTAIGCTRAQGYVFASPEPSAIVEHSLLQTEVFVVG